MYCFWQIFTFSTKNLVIFLLRTYHLSIYLKINCLFLWILVINYYMCLNYTRFSIHRWNDFILDS